MGLGRRLFLVNKKKNASKTCFIVFVKKCIALIGPLCDN